MVLDHYETVRTLINLIVAHYGYKSSLTKFVMNPNTEKDMKEAIVASWDRTLSDIPAETLMAAWDAWSQSRTWPPDPVELRKMILTYDMPDAGQQWAEIKKCFNDPDHYEQLPEATKEAIRGVGGMQAIRNGNEDVVRSNFIRIYENAAQRAAEKALIAPEIKEKLKALAGGQMLLEGGSEDE